MNRSSPAPAGVGVLALVLTAASPSLAADPAVTATSSQRVHPVLLRNGRNEVVELVVNVRGDDPVMLRAARFTLEGTDEVDDIEVLELFAAGKASGDPPAARFGEACPA